MKEILTDINKLPIRVPFDSNLEKKDVIIKVKELTNFSDSELGDFRRIFNRYGFAVLCMKNSESLSKYYGDNGISILDSEMGSLSNFFGDIYLHDRSNNNRVDIKSGQSLNSAFMGTTSEVYPAHVDGIYDDIPPSVVTLFSFKPCRNMEGQSTIISGKLVYDFIKNNFGDYIDNFFNHKFQFVRGEKKTYKTILSRIEHTNRIRISYRNDREVKIAAPENANFETVLDQVVDFIRKPSNAFSIYLEKGQLLVLDNTAVLHGRKGFKDTGRWLCRYSFLGKKDNDSTQFFFGIPEKAHY